MIRFIKNDGGRAASGYRGETGDCVARAIAIITEQPYHKVYANLALVNQTMLKTDRRKTAGIYSAANGIYIRSTIFKRHMQKLGFVWVPTMNIGTGCQIRLRAEELPKGRLIVRLSGHVSAVINGVIYDNHDPSRDGTRCVYGYWKFSN